MTQTKAPDQSNLDRMLSSLRHVCYGIENENLQRAFQAKIDTLNEEITPLLQHDVFAMCKVGHIDSDTMDISNYSYAEDYSVLTGTYKYEDDSMNHHEFDSEHAAIEGIAAILKEQRINDAIDDETYFLREEGAGFYVYDEDPDEDDGVEPEFLFSADNEPACREFIFEHMGYDDQDMEDEADAVVLNEVEFEPDEIYVNTLFQFNDGDALVPEAVKCNLSVVEFSHENHHGERWLGLSGCGMDLSPRYVAYKALVHQAINVSDIHRLQSDPSYFKYALGNNDTFQEVIEILGIADIINKKLAEKEGE